MQAPSSDPRVAVPRQHHDGPGAGYPVAAVHSVRRDDLIDGLGARDAPPITALIAPPGYGKTTLLTLWASCDRRPFAWLRLTDMDNDPVHLLTGVVNAYERCGPLEDVVAGPLPAASDRVFATILPRLLARLAAWDEPVVLVLDDVHLLTDRTALDVVSVLLDQLPDGFKVAIAGRSEPRLPLARLRANRTLRDIGARELALDVEETIDLAAHLGVTLQPREARELATRTEGWAAGIYLAVLAGMSDSDLAVGHASGADKYISDYLRTEVGRALTNEDLTFLTRTSVLDVVSPDAARAVSGFDDAARRLDRLASVNLLVGRVASTPESYRYHSTLREYLRAELDRREPDSAGAIHVNAAAHYAATGDGAAAIGHAFESGDLDAAAGYLRDYMVPLYQAGHGTQLKRWLQRLPPPALEREPTVAVLAAWVYLLEGAADHAELYAEMAERVESTNLHAGRPEFEGPRRTLRMTLGRDGLAAMIADARSTFDDPAVPVHWRSVAGTLLVFGLQADPDFDRDEVEAILSRIIAMALPAAAEVQMSAHALRALTRLRAGDLDAALVCSARARDVLARATRTEAVTSLVVLAVDARVRALLGDHAAARESLVQAQLVRPLASHASPWQSVPPLLDLARAYLVLSDPGGAQTAIRQAEDIVRRRPQLGGYIDQLIALRRMLDDAATTLAGSSTLTAAELRVLSLLPTYLSFEEIGERLNVSRNTVKTHAMSIYGKLWASSRGEAVERAVDLGLLEPYPVLRRREVPHAAT